MEKPTVCVWGDSLAKGVFFDEARGRYAILKDHCLRLLAREAGFDVRCDAVMGRTAPECLSAIHREERIAGALAVFEFGGNDSDMDWAAVAREPDRDHPARVSLPAFKAALVGLAEFARRGGMQPVFTVPLPLDGDRYFHWVSKGLDADAILRYLGGDPHMMYRWQEQYAGAVRDAARMCDVPVLDLRGTMLGDRHFRDYYCLDGIHLNEKGHRKLCEYILKTWEEGQPISDSGDMAC